MSFLRASVKEKSLSTKKSDDKKQDSSEAGNKGMHTFYSYYSDRIAIHFVYFVNS